MVGGPAQLQFFFSSVLIKPPSWAVIAGRRPACNLPFRRREKLRRAILRDAVLRHFLDDGILDILAGV